MILFVSFNKQVYPQVFVEYIDKKNRNMKFSAETEINGVTFLS